MGTAAGEVERLRGNPNLRRPAIRRSSGSSIPDTVPFRRKICRAGDQAVIASCRRVDLEVVAGVPVAKGIQQHRDSVVVGHAVILQRMHLDRLGVGVVAMEAEDQRVFVEEHAYLRLIRIALAWMRRLLSERHRLGFLPIRLAELAVDVDRACRLPHMHDGKLCLANWSHRLLSGGEWSVRKRRLECTGSL